MEELEKLASEEAALKKRGTTKNEVAKFIKKIFKRYFIDAFGGMAQGLFVTLIAGTILKQIGTEISKAGTQAGLAVGNTFIAIGTIASVLMGAGIGAGIAKALKASNLVIFSAIVAGIVGAFSPQFIAGNQTLSAANFMYTSIGPGNPIGAYVTALIAVEVGIFVSGKTKLDILVVPLVMLLASIAGAYAAWPFIKFIDLIAKGIIIFTDITPFFMGMLIAAVMGLLLTLPTSSAAMWVAIAGSVMVPNAFGTPEYATMALAGGAAVVGCAAHMVGFAVASFRENKWGGLVSQGLGTSMLQIPNIMKNPRILLPSVAASIVVGPLATTVFKLRCTPSGGGMGTSGLVGVFGVIDESMKAGLPGWQIGLGIALLMFIIPAAVSLLVSELLRKVNWIKKDDQLLNL
ncbi:MAG: PTS sugar transporter subunit IIC [Clostridiaceae bacterium]|jgi:uncharacterized membrane protein|nr:PTS sugar transporter subunit IIC [Clostridiaceae bacterium]